MYSFSSPSPEHHHSAHHQHDPRTQDPVFCLIVRQHTEGVKLFHISVPRAYACHIVSKRDHVSHDEIVADRIGKDPQTSKGDDFCHCPEILFHRLHLAVSCSHHQQEYQGEESREKKAEQDPYQIDCGHLRVPRLYHVPQIPVLLRLFKSSVSDQDPALTPWHGFSYPRSGRRSL